MKIKENCHHDLDLRWTCSSMAVPIVSGFSCHSLITKDLPKHFQRVHIKICPPETKLEAYSLVKTTVAGKKSKISLLVVNKKIHNSEMIKPFDKRAID